MLYDAKAARKKLHAAWRGTFVITGFGGEHGKSYTLSSATLPSTLLLALGKEK